MQNATKKLEKKLEKTLTTKIKKDLGTAGKQPRRRRNRNRRAALKIEPLPLPSPGSYPSSVAGLQRATLAVEKSIHNQKLRGPVASILETFALPFDHRPKRFSTIYKSNNTAVAGPQSTIDAGMCLTDTANPSHHLDVTEWACFQFRSLLRHVVVLDATISDATYVAYFPGTGSGTTSTVIASVSNGGALVDQFINFLRFGYSSGYRPHGDYLYPGEDAGTEGARWIWKNSKSNASTFSLSFGALLSSATWKLWKWNPGGAPTLVSSVNSVLGAVSAVLTCSAGSGYYTISVATGSNVSTFSATSLDTGTDHWCHKPAPFINDNITVIDGAIITTFAHWLTNESSQFYINGSLVQFQAPQETQWFVDYPTFSSISEVKGNVLRTAINGSYSFVKPTQPSDFEVKRSIDYNGGVLRRCTFNLNNDSSYLVTFSKIEGANARRFKLRFTLHLDFQTVDQWRDVFPPEHNPDEFDEALKHMAQIPQFHENKSHVSQLMRKIKNVITSDIPRVLNQGVHLAERYGPMVVKGARFLSSLA